MILPKNPKNKELLYKKEKKTQNAIIWKSFLQSVAGIKLRMSVYL